VIQDYLDDMSKVILKWLWNTPLAQPDHARQDRWQYTALGDTVNTGARFCSAAPACNVLVGLPTYEACAEYIAVDELPGLQLKGKSAETFRIFNVTAIRETKTSPWVPMPTDGAKAAYNAKRRLYATQSIFA
jgi:hypothetical protein